MSRIKARKIIGFVVFAIVLVISAFAVVKNIKGEVDAATPEGTNVTFTSTGAVPYPGDPTAGTNKFIVSSSSGGAYRGYCAEASKKAPLPPYQDTWPARKLSDTNMQYNKIKLLIYIFEANTPTTIGILDGLFQGIPDPDTRYLYIHAAISYAYANDLSYLGPGEIDWAKNVMDYWMPLYINDNYAVWQEAQAYQLYGININNVDPTIQNVVWIEPAYGSLTLNKTDSETGSCTNTSEKLSLNGSTFQVIDKSTSAVVASGSLSGGNCSLKFDNLPYGNYTVKETATGTGYAPNNNSYDVTIPGTNNSSDVTISIPNQMIRGDVKFIKMDEANQQPLANVLFSISRVDDNNNVLETHIVVSNQDGIVNTSASFIPHTTNTNGYDDLYDGVEPITFMGYGTWFGKDSQNKSLPVNNALGALPYGKYLIQELRCDANLFCTDIMNQKQTITINSANQVVDLGNWNNTCAKFTLDTVAVDNKDGDKFVEVSDKVEIKETVDYCVKAKMDFVLKGVLMDKATGEALLIDGKKVEQSTTINSEDACGKVDLVFAFDATGLAGKEIVVFDQLYYKDSQIVIHEDLSDKDQTINLISLETYAVNRATLNKTLPLNEDVEILDTVKYCLKPGLEYTIKGVLMDKRTGNGLLVGSEPVEQTHTFTPKEECGEFEMIYKLNTKDLGGAELVIFDSLYLDDEVILEHKDIENVDETVTVELPPPDTGFSTAKADNGKETSPVLLVMITTIVSIAGYAGYRVISRKKFLYRK